MNLIVKVSDRFSLNAGAVKEDGKACLILPPEQSLFDQLHDWLDQLPPPTIGFHYWALGIGATALCLRWGTYLAVLMDTMRPLDPRATKRTTSMISDQEMKRINIEASSNLAYILKLWHEDEFRFFDLLRRAYEWLPMPQRRIKWNRSVYHLILGTLMTVHAQNLSSSPENSGTALEHPYRSLANAIISLVYRNGPIENIHAGSDSAYCVGQRRFTTGQTREVLRFTSERLSAIVGLYPLWDDKLPDLPPWPQRLTGLPFLSLYPHDWSLTDLSSEIRLRKEWCAD